MSVKSTRLNAYRVMWTIVMYDLPSETKKEKRISQLFRKDLMRDGFTMFQFSMYLRHSPSAENADVHKRRVIKNLPEYGKVGILQVTDKQFERMEIFYGTKKTDIPEIPQQLELF